MPETEQKRGANEREIGAREVISEVEEGGEPRWMGVKTVYEQA